MIDQNTREQEIDLLECFYAWLRHWRFVAKITGVFTVLAILYCLIVSPTYQAVSMIWVRKDRGIGASILENALVNDSGQLANTYMEIFKTQEVLSPVVAKYPDNYQNITQLANTFTLSTVKNTNLFSIAVDGKDPQMVKDVNDALLENFLEHLSTIERQQFSVTRRFLDTRVRDFRYDLFKAEDNLQKFEKEHNIVSKDSAVTMAMNRLSNTDEMKIKNRINLEIANAKVAVAKEQMRGKNLQAIADSPTLNRLREELAELESKRVQAAARYTSKHPMMIQLNENIRILRNKMEQEITRVVNLDAPPSGLYAKIYEERLRNEAEARVAQSNLDSIARIERDFMADIGRMSNANKEHLRLLRDVTVAQEIYTILAKRLEEAKVAEVSISQEARIASRALVPDRPIAPKKARTVTLALLLGFLLSSFFVLFRELMNRTITSPDDVDKYLNLPVLGVVPDFDLLQLRLEEQNRKDEEDVDKTLLQRVMEKAKEVGESLWQMK